MRLVSASQDASSRRLECEWRGIAVDDDDEVCEEHNHTRCGICISFIHPFLQTDVLDAHVADHNHDTQS